MIALCVALGVLAGIAVLPVGVRASYDLHGALLQLIIGPLRFTLIPSDEQPKTQNAKQKSHVKKRGESTQTGKANSGGSFSDFLPIVDVVFDLLRDFKKKVKISRLEFKLVLAGDDPCDLSLNYGKAWTLLGNLMPVLENSFYIGKRDIQVECDYLADETTVFALVDITMTVGRLLSIVARYGVRGLIEYRKLLNIRKGGAKV